MKYIALLWDPTPAKTAERVLTLLPTSSTPSPCCKLSTAPIPTSSPQWASSVLILSEFQQWGWKGVEESFPYAATHSQLQGPPRPVHRTGLTLRFDPLTDQVSLVSRTTPRFHFWKKAFMIPQNLLMDWNVTKGWIWFVYMKTTAYFWRVHWGVCMPQNSIRKGDIFVSRS